MTELMMETLPPRRVRRRRGEFGRAVRMPPRSDGRPKHCQWAVRRTPLVGYLVRNACPETRAVSPSWWHSWSSGHHVAPTPAQAVPSYQWSNFLARQTAVFSETFPVPRPPGVFAMRPPFDYRALPGVPGMGHALTVDPGQKKNPQKKTPDQGGCCLRRRILRGPQTSIPRY